MSKTFLFAAGIVWFAALVAHADWIHDMTSEDCSPESRDIVAANVRNQIESSVRRAEAAINPPSPVGDLSCLDGLMDIRLDDFGTVGGLEDLFTTSLDGLLDLGKDQTRRICKFAEQKWKEVTGPVSSAIPGFGHAASADSGSRNNLTRETGIKSGRSIMQSQGSHKPSSDRNQPNAPPSATKPAVESDPISEIWNSIYGKGAKE